jgi:hypothetical protein
MKLAHLRLLGALWLLPAVAAQAVTITLAPSEALRCLTPGEAERGAVDYPKELFDRKEGGVVDVELTFTAPSDAPKVNVTNEPVHELANAVQRHVRKYRVPCLGAGQTTTLRQSFQFSPTDGRKVNWTRVRDSVETTQRVQTRCIVHSTTQTPSYPLSALRQEAQGTVMLRLTFASADGAPQTEVLDDTPHPHLIEAATRHAVGYRMPCHSGQAVSTVHEYRFKIDGGDRIVAKDVGLVTFLRSVKDIQKAQVYFDLNTMQCPFDVRIELRQPIGDNRVGEVGDAVAERQFFLEWLSRLRLNVDRQTQNRLLGQPMTISVPCGVVSLGNRPGGGASQ